MANDYFDFLSQNAQDENARVESTNDGFVNLTTRADAECQVVCDGDFLFLLNPNQITKEKAPVGQHILQFISIEYPDIVVEKIVDFPEAGKNYLVMVNEFSALISAKVKHVEEKKAASEAKARAKAEEAKKKAEEETIGTIGFIAKLGGKGTFTGPIKEGKPFGKGKVIFESGNVYEGEFKDGWRHGYGTFKMNDGFIYEGEFKEDMRTGKGKLTAPDGRKWEGEFLDGQAHGKVKCYFTNGATLEGIWEKGDTANKPNIYTWPNGDRLECEGWDGGSNGKGVYYWKDGKQESQTWSHGLQVKENASIEWTLFINGIKGSYTGRLVNGVPNGKGHFESTENDLSKYPYIYDGEWVDGKRQGKGTNLLPTNDKYEGEFVGDRRNGYGVIQYKDGGRYEGEWKDGLRHGKGKYITSPKRIAMDYEGEWKNDKPDGEGTIFDWPMGLTTIGKYTGQVKDGKPEGKGHFEVTKDNTSSYPHQYPCVYDGDWHLGKRHGKGKIIWPKGDKYEGDWFEGKRHGKGVMLYSDGSSYNGEWQNNMRQGRGKFISHDGWIHEGYWVNDKKNWK